jgi:hypothetical protein
MISFLLAKSYGIILEKKKSLWLESMKKNTKCQAGFRSYSTFDCLLTFRIIIEKFQNNKTNLLCCFIVFRKAFDSLKIIYGRD